jgi:hypothetical protein
MDRLGMDHDARSWVARLDARTNSKYRCTREEIYAIKAVGGGIGFGKLMLIVSMCIRKWRRQMCPDHCV